jgi:hypothetical protein
VGSRIRGRYASRQVIVGVVGAGGVVNGSTQPCSSAAAPPDFLTVEEAARVVRIGRTKAYDLARLFLATGGTDGLPVIRFGKQLRVPRCRLEACLGGPITWPPVVEENSSEPATAIDVAADDAIAQHAQRANEASVTAADDDSSNGRAASSSRTRRTADGQAPRLFSV